MRLREHGYTILEALCAFAILSVMLVVLYGLGGTTLKMQAASRDADQVGLLAQSKLDELATERTELSGFQIGQFQGTDIRWRLETQDIPQPEGTERDVHLQALRLVLIWPSLRGTNEYSVTSRHIWIEKP